MVTSPSGDQITGWWKMNHTLASAKSETIIVKGKRCGELVRFSVESTIVTAKRVLNIFVWGTNVARGIGKGRPQHSGFSYCGHGCAPGDKIVEVLSSPVAI